MRLPRRCHGRLIPAGEAYNNDGACTNAAAEIFLRMRRGEIGHYHHIRGAYLLRWAKSTWRETTAALRMAIKSASSRLLACRPGRASISAATGSGISGCSRSPVDVCRVESERAHTDRGHK